MPVAAENDDAGARWGRPHGFEDLLALMEVAGPGVGGAEAPVASEGNGGNNEFPFRALGLWVGEVGEEGGELSGAEHRFLWGFRGEVERRSAVAAGIEEEERGWTVGKGEVGRVGMYRRRIDGGVVKVPRVGCGGVRVSGVTVPVVSDLMVIEDVEPRQGFGNRRPVGGRVDLAVLAAIGFWIVAHPPRNVDVDKVAKEKHEGCFKGWKPLRHVFEARDR